LAPLDRRTRDIVHASRDSTGDRPTQPRPAVESRGGGSPSVA
jgi:hypothetical protein